MGGVHPAALGGAARAPGAPHPGPRAARVREAVAGGLVGGGDALAALDDSPLTPVDAIPDDVDVPAALRDDPAIATLVDDIGGWLTAEMDRCDAWNGGSVTPGTDALVAFNDELAVRMLRALRRSGIEVPSRVRVTGVDGLEISTLVSPDLTTLALDIDRVAREAVELVAGMLEGTVPLRGEEAHRRVDYRLVVREST